MAATSADRHLSYPTTGYRCHPSKRSYAACHQHTLASLWLDGLVLQYSCAARDAQCWVQVRASLFHCSIDLAVCQVQEPNELEIRCSAAAADIGRGKGVSTGTTGALSLPQVASEGYGEGLEIAGAVFSG